MSGVCFPRICHSHVFLKTLSQCVCRKKKPPPTLVQSLRLHLRHSETSNSSNTNFSARYSLMKCVQRYLAPVWRCQRAQRQYFTAKLFLLHWSDSQKNINLGQNSNNHSWGYRRVPTEQRGQLRRSLYVAHDLVIQAHTNQVTAFILTPRSLCSTYLLLTTGLHPS